MMLDVLEIPSVVSNLYFMEELEYFGAEHANSELVQDVGQCVESSCLKDLKSAEQETII